MDLRRYTSRQIIAAELMGNCVVSVVGITVTIPKRKEDMAIGNNLLKTGGFVRRYMVMSHNG